MLNRALRIENIEILYLFRFIIKDIFEQLKQHQCQIIITVYRGQLMSTNELNMFRQWDNRLISINSFFSTSLSRQTALHFVRLNENIDDLHRILFEIRGDFDSSLQCLHNALEIQQKSFSKHYIDTSRLYHSIANIYSLKGKNH